MSAPSARGLLRTTYVLPMRVASPLHVGAGAGDALVDDLVARDGAGRPVVPGTTLAGVLRALTARLAPDDEVRLWGSVDGSSPLAVADAVLDLGDRGIWARTGIAIDRTTGAVASGALYDVAVVPAGTAFELELELDDPALEPRVLDLLGAVLHHGLTLGRGGVRGMGRVVVDGPAETAVTVRRLDLGDPVALAGLAGGTPPPAEPVPLTARAVPGVVEVRVAWSSPTPVLSRDPLAAGGIDDLPLMLEGADGRHRLALPGSSIRGALRAHAERIVRTVAGIAPASEGIAAERLAVDQRLPLVDRLFGTAKETAQEGRVASGRRSAVTVHDVLGRDPIDPAAVAGLDREAAGESVPLGDVDGSAGTFGEVLVANHVGIDRWTGGAVPGVLYDAAEPRGVRWEPIVLELDTDLLGRDLEGDLAAPGATSDHGDAAAGLLLLVLEDLAAGRIPLGGLVTRGRGTVEVTAMRWGAAGWSPPGEDDPDRSPSDGWDGAEDVRRAREAWARVAGAWVAAGGGA